MSWKWSKKIPDRTYLVKPCNAQVGKMSARFREGTIAVLFRGWSMFNRTGFRFLKTIWVRFLFPWYLDSAYVFIKMQIWLDQAHPDIFPNRAKSFTITYKYRLTNLILWYCYKNIPWARGDTIFIFKCWENFPPRALRAQ